MRRSEEDRNLDAGARRRFSFGVNYWPRKKGMYWWKDFDQSEVEQEFGEIAALGLQVVRIFLFWEDFQPAPDRINDRAVNDLGTVLDVATELGLKVMPTFFTGHMSGINWWPTWALADDEGPTDVPRVSGGELTPRLGRDPYTDAALLDAQRLLLAGVVGRYGNHPAVFAWNVSNEPDLFATPRSYADGAIWNQTMAREIRRYSDKPITAGMHLPTVSRYNGFRPDLLTQHNDFLSMHAYSIYYSLTAQDDPLDSDVVPLACLVTEALGSKRVLLEEFGYASSEYRDAPQYVQVPGGMMQRRLLLADDSAGELYYRHVLAKLIRCGALGAYAWMFSDYDPALWDKAPFDTHVHERSFGLTRHDGSVKPSGEVMRMWAERAKVDGLPERTIGPLTLKADSWYQDPMSNFDLLFARWRGQLEGD